MKFFYIPRSHPDGFSVNARCLDAGTVQELIISQVNGRDWEKPYPAGRGSYDDATDHMNTDFRKLLCQSP